MTDHDNILESCVGLGSFSDHAPTKAISEGKDYSGKWHVYYASVYLWLPRDPTKEVGIYLIAHIKNGRETVHRTPLLYNIQTTDITVVKGIDLHYKHEYVDSSEFARHFFGVSNKKWLVRRLKEIYQEKAGDAIRKLRV